MAALSSSLLVGAFACEGSDDARPGQTTVTVGAGGATSSTAAAIPQSSSGSGSLSFIGRSCEIDGHCGPVAGARCIRPTDDEPRLGIEAAVIGGPPGGYCSQTCLAHSDCPSDSFCRYDLDLDAGLCVLGCTFGTPVATSPQQPTPSFKCRGRDELACVPMQDGFELCLPVCGADAECGPDRKCDQRGGVCVDKPTEGEPLSAACSPGIDDPCAGFCLAFSSEGQTVSHACASRCSFGGSLDETSNCGGPLKGICAFTPTIDATASELGDMAYCSGACTKHDACDFASGMFCLDVGEFAKRGVGYCLFADRCPNGNECESGETCRQTKAGPFCLDADPNGSSPTDLLLPLGSASP